MTYDGKNVASVAYVADNSQICIERHNRTLGTLTSIDAGGSRVWSLLGEDETGRPATVGLGSLTLSRGFDPAGRLTAQRVSHSGRPDIQNAAYQYDCETGNMTMRTDPSGMVSYDYKNWTVDLDDVYVIGTRTIPNPWLQYYSQILPRVQYNVFDGKKPLEAAPDNSLPIEGLKADINTPNNVSFLAVTNTSVSLPVNIINQHWTSVLKTEAAQIAQMRQTQATAAVQKALQAKQAQYQSLSKATTTIGKVSKALNRVSAATTIYSIGVDLAEGHKAKAVARATVAAATYLSVYIPIAGPFVSAGLGIADAIWGEQFYDWVDDNF